MSKNPYLALMQILCLGVWLFAITYNVEHSQWSHLVFILFFTALGMVMGTRRKGKASE